MAIELYNADCYEKIKDIPDNSVDLVIIDPPYLFNNGGGGGNREPKIATGGGSTYQNSEQKRI